jgi:ubiquinol-cytochrome c reductase cytochrome b subunit
MPILGKWKPVDYFNRAATAAFFIVLIGFSYLSYSQDAKDPKQQIALAEEEFRAARTIDLAHANGIPPTGALTLLRDDPKAEGRRLFKQNCAACHNATDAEGKGIAAEKTSAPNLHAFATREWIAGLLDPKKIRTEQYFGATKIRGGMIDFVRKELPEDEELKTNLQKVVIALSAEAKLPSQCDADAKDLEAIKEGRDWIVEKCVRCHKFHEHDEGVGGPDLTGYGSHEWIAAFTANPKSKRFYGSKNDRMPSYAESKDAKQNQLSPHDLEMLAAWLRGEWFELQGRGENTDK